MNLSDLAHALALQELAKDETFRAFVKGVVVVGLLGVALGAYASIMLYAVLGYLGQVSL